MSFTTSTYKKCKYLNSKQKKNINPENKTKALKNAIVNNNLLKVRNIVKKDYRVTLDDLLFADIVCYNHVKRQSQMRHPRKYPIDSNKIFHELSFNAADDIYEKFLLRISQPVPSPGWNGSDWELWDGEYDIYIFRKYNYIFRQIDDFIIWDCNGKEIAVHVDILDSSHELIDFPRYTPENIHSNY